MVDNLKVVMEEVIGDVQGESVENLAQHIILNMRTQNEKIYQSICRSADAAFFYSPLLNKIDVNCWKNLLTDEEIKKVSSSDDVLASLLRWAVSNKEAVRKNPGQMTELFDLINIEEISEDLTTNIGAWNQLEKVID